MDPAIVVIGVGLALAILRREPDAPPVITADPREDLRLRSVGECIEDPTAPGCSQSNSAVRCAPGWRNEYQPGTREYRECEARQTTTSAQETNPDADLCRRAARDHGGLVPLSHPLYGRCIDVGLAQGVSSYGGFPIPPGTPELTTLAPSDFGETGAVTRHGGVRAFMEDTERRGKAIDRVVRHRPPSFPAAAERGAQKWRDASMETRRQMVADFEAWLEVSRWGMTRDRAWLAYYYAWETSELEAARRWRAGLAMERMQRGTPAFETFAPARFTPLFPRRGRDVWCLPSRDLGTPQGNAARRGPGTQPCPAPPGPLVYPAVFDVFAWLGRWEAVTEPYSPRIFATRVEIPLRVQIVS